MFKGPGPGRPPGTPNKTTSQFKQTLADAGFDTAKALLGIHMEALKQYQVCDDGLKPVYLNTALNAVKEIASYCLPKLKSIEHRQESLLGEMNSQQKLEALKQAVLIMEREVKAIEVKK